MATRPAIPAELRRDILVESGHRCAIQTCRHPEVDLHHIVPWEKCLEHTADNLIALCPNCHRRADAGEIDRKALRMYKARLTAARGIEEARPDPAPGLPTGVSEDKREHWTTDRVSDAHESFPLYEVDIEFPVFGPSTPDLDELNTVLKANALRDLHSFRDVLLTADRSDKPEWTHTVASYTSVSFEIAAFNESVVSIRYSGIAYESGTLHPHPVRDVVNYQRDPLVPLSLDTVFVPVWKFADMASAYARSQLALEDGTDELPEWMMRGTEPEVENWSLFNLTDKGVLITLPEYQIGPYIGGARYVLIPWARSRELLNPRCKVPSYWT